MLYRVLFLSWMTFSPALSFAHAHEGDLMNVPKAFTASSFETADSVYSAAGKTTRESSIPQSIHPTTMTAQPISAHSL
jgi:hypothetical protein